MDLAGLSAVLLGVAALLVGLSLPLRRRRVGPNAWFGLRTASTLADERVWFEANAKAGADLARIGYGLALATLGLPGLLGSDLELLIGVLTGSLVVAVLASALVRARGARRHLERLRADPAAARPDDSPADPPHRG